MFSLCDEAAGEVGRPGGIGYGYGYGYVRLRGGLREPRRWDAACVLAEVEALP